VTTTPTVAHAARSRRTRFAAAVVALALVGFGADRAIGAAAATSSSLPPPPACPQAAQSPTSAARYGLPIANYIENGTLTQGTTKITNINATVCGLLQFPSLSAEIPASNIRYGTVNGPAKLTLDGVQDGTVDIMATGPSTAVTSRVPAPNGGLVFTLTAETNSILNIGATTITLPVLGKVRINTPVQCTVTLSLTLNTDPTAGGKALVGPLARGAEGTAFATGVDDRELTTGNLEPYQHTATDDEVCSTLNSSLHPHPTKASFTAPLIFYSTLTHF
jgi:hypothetical protein